MRNIFLHFTKICKHKRWVFYYCCKAGIPIRGFFHDMSKFNPIEFWESVKYYQGTSSPINECKKINGYSKAWMHHKGKNPHHYEYWQDNFDQGGNSIKMPFIYALEMVCDYLGAGRAYMEKTFTYEKEYEWWLDKSSNPIAMHPHTKAFVNKMLLDIKNNQDLKCLQKRNAKRIYENL